MEILQRGRAARLYVQNDFSRKAARFEHSWARTLTKP
jgi:hypothetical protein